MLLWIIDILALNRSLKREAFVTYIKANFSYLILASGRVNLVFVTIETRPFDISIKKLKLIINA